MGNQPWPQFHNGMRERSIQNVPRGEIKERFADDFEEEGPSDSKPKARRKWSQQKHFVGPKSKGRKLTVLSVKMDP